MSTIIHNNIGLLAITLIPIQFFIWKSIHEKMKYPEYVPYLYTFLNILFCAFIAYLFREGRTFHETCIGFITTTYLNVWWAIVVYSFRKK